MPRVGQCDQQAPRADPDPVDEDGVMNLAGDGHSRVQLPVPRGLVAEGPAGTAVEVGLGALSDQPGQEPA